MQNLASKLIINIKPVFKTFSDLVFPRRCIVCEGVLDTDERYICTKCVKDIPFTWFWAFGENPAEERLWKRVGIVAAASLFFYRKDGGYAELLHEVKYGGNLRLGRLLGRTLGEKMRESGRFSEVQIIVPVPLHPLRRWHRGYNQAEIIAAGIAEGLSGNVRVMSGVLRRSRYTRTQTRLSGESKERNVQNAFAVNKHEMKRLMREGISHILIVDDILTSGSTLEAVIKPLLPHFLVSVATIGFVE